MPLSHVLRKGPLVLVLTSSLEKHIEIMRHRLPFQIRGVRRVSSMINNKFRFTLSMLHITV